MKKETKWSVLLELRVRDLLLKHPINHRKSGVEKQDRVEHAERTALAKRIRHETAEGISHAAQGCDGTSLSGFRYATAPHGCHR